MAKKANLPKSKAKVSSAPLLVSCAGTWKTGLTAFNRGDFAEAVQQWTRAECSEKPGIELALSEAYLRRALNMRTSLARGIKGLQEAVQMTPKDGRCWYHLGRLLQKNNQPTEALDAYECAASLGASYPQMGYNRALALLERDPATDLKGLEWLKTKERTKLQPIAALLRGVSKDVPTFDFENFAGGNRLWLGLAQYALGNLASARPALAADKAHPQPKAAETIRAFFSALTSEALSERVAAIKTLGPSAQAQDYLRVAEATNVLRYQEMQAQHLAGDVAAFLQSYRVNSTSPTSLPFTVEQSGAIERAAQVALTASAQEAARRGEGQKALTYCEQAYKLLFPVSSSNVEIPRYEAVLALHNIAVCLERFGPKGSLARPVTTAKTIEMWVQFLLQIIRLDIAGGAALERVPGTLAEQRAWTRNHVLTLIQEHTEITEASVWLRAIRDCDPTDADVCIEVVRATAEATGPDAALKELDKVIARHPSNEKAVMVKCEIHLNVRDTEGFFETMRTYLKVAQPSAECLDSFVFALVSEGGRKIEKKDFVSAIEYFEEAYAISPRNCDVLTGLVESHYQLDGFSRAERYYNELLAVGTEEAFGFAFDWVLSTEEPALEHWALLVIVQAVAVNQDTENLYLECLISAILYEKGDLEHFLVSKLKDPESPHVQESIFDQLLDRMPPFAKEYAEKRLAARPDDICALFCLGQAFVALDDFDEAEATFKKVVKLGRKQKGPETERAVKLAQSWLDM